MAAPYSADLRQRIVDAYQNGEGSQEELAEQFSVAPNTVLNYLNLQRSQGSVKPRPHGGGRPPRIEGRALQELLEQKNDSTLKELVEEYERRYRVRVHLSTMARAIERLRFTRKKKTSHGSERERPDVQCARADFVDEVSEVPPQKLLFVDEFGTNLGMSRRYGWALSGERVHGAVPTNPDPNVTLVMGLRMQGLVAPFAFRGAMDGQIFRHYVETQLAPTLGAGDVVYADQVGAHRVAGVRDAIERRGAEYRLLPPYSPDFSPVEQCGSKVKEALRAAQPRTVDALVGAMGNALHSVTASDARGWFERVGYIHPRRRRIRLRPGAHYYPRQPSPLDFVRGRDPRGRRERPRPTPGREPL